MNDKTSLVGEPTSLAPENAEAFDRCRKAFDNVVQGSIDRTVSDACTGSATKTSFTALELGSTGNDCPAKLARMALYACYGAVAISPTVSLGKEIVLKVLATRFAFCCFLSKLIGALSPAGNLTHTGAAVVSLELCSAYDAVVHT